MKALTREFSKKEKILILVLLIILLALCYYRFVYIPISEAIEQAQLEQENLLNEEVITQAQLNRLKKMADEVEEIKANGVKSIQLSYNGSKPEVAYLNDVLANTLNYTLNFTGITRTGDQVRRNFSLNFTTGTSQQADAVIKQLNDSPYRIKIDDVSFSKKTYRYNRIAEFPDYLDYEIVHEYSVALTATFYETTVGGTPDAGLPADSAKK